MDKKYKDFWIVTVVDSISATSMPINEFVIYRSKNNYEVKQTVIVCDTSVPDDVILPECVEFILTGNDTSKIRKTVKEIESSKMGMQVIYHIHHQKAGFYFFKSTLGLRIRERTLFTVHSTYKDRDLKYKITSIVSVLLAKKANCVCKYAYNEYSTIVKYLKRGNFISISNGADFSRVEKCIQIKRNDDYPRRTLICIGRMIPLKNHIFLIELLKNLPDVELILVGAEDQNHSIRKLVSEYGIADRVKFTGLISREKVFEILSQCDIYVSASHIEGLPVSVLEAMSAGTVPVLSDIGPHREIKEHCSDVCVLPLEQSLWKRKIMELINMPEQSFENLSQRIKREVRTAYSLEEMHEQYFQLYQSLCNQK